MNLSLGMSAFLTGSFTAYRLVFPECEGVIKTITGPRAGYLASYRLADLSLCSAAVKAAIDSACCQSAQREGDGPCCRTSVAQENKVVLMVEDDEATAAPGLRALMAAGRAVRIATSVTQALALMERESYLAILLHHDLPDGSASMVVEAAKAQVPQVPVILITAKGCDTVAVEAIHLGGADYFRKTEMPWHQLPQAVDRAAALSQFEEQLRNTDALFHLIVTHSTDVITVADVDGTIQYVTPGVTTLLGYRPSEMIGTRLFERAHEEDREWLEALLVGLPLTHHFSAAYRKRRKDGAVVWVEANADGIRNPATGKVDQVVMIKRDITERKRAEEASRQAEEQFRALLESAPAGMVIVNGEGRIVLVNAQAERLFGYSREEMVGYTMEMLIPAATPLNCARLREDYQEGSGFRQMRSGLELKGLRKAGPEFPIEISLSPIRAGKESWVAAAIRDISDRKVVEQLVASSHRAEEANRAKSEFLAVMSHEIRTPMNAIMGMSDLLSETALDPDQRQYVEVFRRAGASLLALINDILDFSKIEAGNFELEHLDFDLEELLSESLELVAPKASGKRIVMKASVAPGVPARLRGDPGRLRQVLLNLLGNAAKFTDVGEVVLTVRNDPSGSPGALQFSVSDSGVGIPAEKLDTIFEPFSQGDSSTTRKYGGTGLGLSITRTIVQRLGGKIWVESKTGHGSVFYFTATFEPASASVQPTVSLRDFQGCQVAVVHSNAANRLILREALATWGMGTTEFGSGDEFLASLPVAADALLHSLVFVDGDMPNDAGFEMAATIRNRAPRIPIIMMTSDHLPLDERKLRVSGASGHTAWPLDRANLLRIIHQALRLAPLSELRTTAEPQPDLAESVVNRKLRILVAEDSADNRLLVQLYLKKHAYDLTFVENGKEAVEQFGASQFDLVLMDLQMPVMDGLAATRAIRALERSREALPVPLISLSANARPEDVKMSLQAGCDAHISKPVSREQLLTALQKYALGFRQRTENASRSFELPEEIAALVPGYLAARRKEVARLEELLARREFSEIFSIVHNFKGSGTSYGFPRLTELGGAMQSAAEVDDGVALGLQIRALSSFLDHAPMPQAAESVRS